MSQFDVYKNPSSKTKKLFPYLVDIQNPILSELATRIVIPLGRANAFNNEYMSKLTLELDFNNEKLLLLTPQIASVPSRLLETPVGTVAHIRDDIISTIDFAITG